MLCVAKESGWEIALASKARVMIMPASLPSLNPLANLRFPSQRDGFPSFLFGIPAMWCTKCQADVAAMVSPDNERLYCTTCNLELPRPAMSGAKAGNTPAATPRKPVSDPRELLARWARED